MSEEAAAMALVQFLQDVGDAPEVVWIAAIAMLERALSEAREARHGRFRAYPRGQLRRLRSDVAQAMKLARLGVAMQEADDELYREVREDLQAAREVEGRARRRAQTLPAELARLAKQAARKAGEPPSGNFHLAPDYPRSDLCAEGGDGAGDRGEQLLRRDDAGAARAATRKPAKRPRARVERERGADEAERDERDADDE